MRAIKALSLLTFVLGLAMGGMNLYQGHQATAEIKERIRADLQAGQRIIAAGLIKMRDLGDQLARQYAAGEVPNAHPQIAAWLEAAVSKHPDITGVYVAFRPGAFPGKNPYRAATGDRYGPYARRAGGAVKTTPIRYDYTQPQHRWYHDPLARGAASWTEPEYGQATRDMIVEYTLPLHPPGAVAGKAEPMGVLGVVARLRKLRQAARTLSFSSTGYSALLSPKFKFIHHPRVDVVRRGLTLGQIAAEARAAGKPGAAVIGAAMARMKAGETAVLDYTGIYNDKRMWFGFTPIRPVGWTLVAMCLKAEMAAPEAPLYRSWLRCLTLLLVGGVGLLALSLRRHPWLAVLACTLLIVAGIGAVWSLAVSRRADLAIPAEATALETSGKARCASERGHHNGEGPVLVMGPAAVQREKARHRHCSAEANFKAPVWVPTGLHVQSIEFTDAKHVRVTGYLWQDYTGVAAPPCGGAKAALDAGARGTRGPAPDGSEEVEVEPARARSGQGTLPLPFFPASAGVTPTAGAGPRGCVTRGVVLPTARDVQMKKAYVREENGQELHGWHFEATLREDFDYRKYPLDRETIQILFWHEDFDRNIVLVPDTGAYKTINPLSRPGIEDRLSVPGWRIEASGFSYLRRSYNNNFGIEGYVGQEDFPELVFNVSLQRRFVDPFVAHFIPLLVVLSIVFTILLLTRKKGTTDLAGFNALSGVATCSALVFITILDQINVREHLRPDSLVYLEYFHIISYAAVLFVTVATLSVGLKARPHALSFEDNRVARLAYWPVILALVYIVTLATYY